MNPSIELRRSLERIVFTLTGKKPRLSRSSNVRILRTRIWLQEIFRNFKVDLITLSNAFYKNGYSTGTIKRWLKGKTHANKQSVSRINSLFPGSKDIFYLPVFDLLEINIKRSTINNLKKKYLIKPDDLNSNTEEIFYLWNLPPIKYGKSMYYQETEKIQSNLLFQRGDIHGFTAILILLREAELDNDAYRHEQYMKDAYRSLPSFCRDKRFKKRWIDFYEALKDIHVNMYSTHRLIQPKRDIIKKQIFAKKHETLRALCPVSPITYKYIEPELPYIDYGYHPYD